MQIMKQSKGEINTLCLNFCRHFGGPKLLTADDVIPNLGRKYLVMADSNILASFQYFPSRCSSINVKKATD